MIDALRRGAWPRGIRRVRRELETARQKLRNELGGEPSLSDLANHIGTDEASLGRTINRINIIESTSPLASPDTIENTDLPPVLTPSESPSPDKVCEKTEVNNRVRAAIAALPGRERRIIGLYYYGDATMKQIGAEIGVNESRVSQLHARAIRRLREHLAPDIAPRAPDGDAGREGRQDVAARAAEDEDGEGGAAGGFPTCSGHDAASRPVLTSRATRRRSASR